MRMSNEEFKDELFKRCDRYKSLQRKKRKRVLAICIPLVCIIAAAIPVGNAVLSYLPYFNILYGAASPADDCDTKYEMGAKTGSVLQIEAIDIVSVYADSKDYLEKHITDEETIDIISDCLDSLSNTGKDIYPADKEKYKITIVYADETSISYTYYPDYTFFDSNGNEYTMDKNKAETFYELISELKNKKED